MALGVIGVMIESAANRTEWGHKYPLLRDAVLNKAGRSSTRDLQLYK